MICCYNSNGLYDIPYRSWVLKHREKSIIKNYKENFKYHKKLSKEFPFFVDICDYYENHEKAYNITYNLWDLPKGECVYQDIFNKPCPCCDVVDIKYPDDIINSSFKNAKPHLSKHILMNLKNNPPTYAHSHLGIWINYYLDLTEVDFSYERYYFKTDDMIETFITNFLLKKDNYTIL